MPNFAKKALIFCLILAPTFAVAQVPTPVLFAVQSPSGKVTSYLFGTFHFGIGVNELPDYLRKAQDATQVQFAEDNMIEIADLFRLARTQPHEALERLREKFHAPKQQVTFTPQEIDQLVSLGIPRDFAMEMQDENCTYLFYRNVFFKEPFHSLEAELETRAIAAGKQVIELDSEALSNEAYKSEAQSTCRVRNYLKDPASLVATDKQFNDFRDWYRNLTPELALQLPDDTDDTVTVRTEAWVKTLVPVMQARPAFISVGLDHLVGPKGLIKLLEAKGFVVTPYRP